MQIAIASDHAGYSLKEILKTLLKNSFLEHSLIDLGPNTQDRADYPDFAERMGTKIQTGEIQFGILICGSGIGMNIAANKMNGIRAALVENPVAARLSREHNDANILCLGARFIAPEYAAEIVLEWIKTPFSGGERHRARIKKLNDLEKK